VYCRLLWVLNDRQTCNYYALVGGEEEIGGEAFTWSRARTSIFNKNIMGNATAVPLLQAYTSPCVAQLLQRIVKLASPCPLLNA